MAVNLGGKKPFDVELTSKAAEIVEVKVPTVNSGAESFPITSVVRSGDKTKFALPSKAAPINIFVRWFPENAFKAISPNTVPSKN